MPDMDKFFDRLGEVLKNFLDEDSEHLFGRPQGRRPFGDPDLDEAYDELEEFLNSGKGEHKKTAAWSDTYTQGAKKPASQPSIQKVCVRILKNLDCPLGPAKKSARPLINGC